jgi:hypothetical protein
MAVGRCRITSNITFESGSFTYACVHMGDHNLVGGVRPFDSEDAFNEMRDDLSESFGRVDFPEIVRRLDEHFPGMPFSLVTLFREEQRRIVEVILRASLQSANAAYRQQYEQQSLLAAFLGELGISIPAAFRMTAQVVLNADLKQAFAETPLDVEHIRGLLKESRTWQVDLDEAGLSHQLAQTVERCALAVRDDQKKLAALKELNAALDVVDLVPFSANLIRPQDVVYKLWREARSSAESAAALPPHSQPSWQQRLAPIARRLSIRVVEQEP